MNQKGNVGTQHDKVEFIKLRNNSDNHVSIIIINNSRDMWKIMVTERMESEKHSPINK